MKKLLCVMLLAGGAILPAKVTLSQAVANAWVLDPGLDSQRLEERAAAVARLSALRQKYFSVLFAGGYRYSSDRIEVRAADFPFPPGSAAPADTVILAAPDHTVDLRLSLQQPLYSGGLLSNAVRAEGAREAAERELTRLRKVELAGKVKASFFSHRLYSRKRDSLNFFLAALELHREKVEKLVAEDLARRSDLLETQAKADEARLGLQDLEQRIAAEAVQFKSLCGYEPQEVDPPPATAPEDFASAWERFLSGHPLLRSLAERGRQLAIRQRSVAAAYRPQVSAFAEVHYGRPGQNFFLDRWAFYVQGGVTVSMPVFNWNQGGRDRELLDIAARQLEDRRADFIRESEKGLRQLFLYRESLEKKQALLEGLVANAAEDVRLKENLYEENQIDHTDLLAAMTRQESYIANRGELLAQLEMLQANMDTLVGKIEEGE